MEKAKADAVPACRAMRQDEMDIGHYQDSAPCGETLRPAEGYELYCLLQGTMHYVVSGGRYALRPGVLLLISPGEMRRPDVEGPPRRFDRIVLRIRPAFVREVGGLFPHALRAVDGDPGGCRLLTPDEKTYQSLLRLLFALLEEKERADTESPYLYCLILTQLLLQMNRAVNRALPRAGRPGVRYAEIMNVYDYINGHFRQKINVTQLSGRFYMDRNTLTRQFRRIIGLTPGEYIRRKRLEAAYEMIRKGAGVLNAGYQSGFTDYSAFYRAFVQTYGLPPSRVSSGARREKKAETPQQQEEEA